MLTPLNSLGSVELELGLGLEVPVGEVYPVPVPVPVPDPDPEGQAYPDAVGKTRDEDPVTVPVGLVRPSPTVVVAKATNVVVVA